MTYHITVGVQPGSRYPFALNTEADQIPLTKEELEELKDECTYALAQLDQEENQK
jgi:hypothetical protein